MTLEKYSVRSDQNDFKLEYEWKALMKYKQVRL